MQIIISIEKSDLHHGKRDPFNCMLKNFPEKNSLHFKDAIIEIACHIYKLTMTEP